MAQNASLITARLRRGAPVLICKKCLGRVADGSGLKRALKSEVKRRSVAQAIKKPRIVMTGCFGLCPKRAVAVASAAMLHRNEMLLLADENAAADAVAVLMPDRT